MRVLVCSANASSSFRSAMTLHVVSSSITTRCCPSYAITACFLYSYCLISYCIYWSSRNLNLKSQTFPLLFLCLWMKAKLTRSRVDEVSSWRAVCKKIELSSLWFLQLQRRFQISLRSYFYCNSFSLSLSSLNSSSCESQEPLKQRLYQQFGSMPWLNNFSLTKTKRINKFIDRIKWNTCGTESLRNFQNQNSNIKEEDDISWNHSFRW